MLTNDYMTRPTKLRPRKNWIMQIKVQWMKGFVMQQVNVATKKIVMLSIIKQILNNIRQQKSKKSHIDSSG